MQKNRWFTITKGIVERANKKFTKVENDFCLKLNWHTKVEEVYLTINNLVKFAV